MSQKSCYIFGEWLLVYTVICVYVATTFFGTLFLESLIIFRPYVYVILRSSMIYWQLMGSPPLPERVAMRSERVQGWLLNAMQRHGVYSITGFKAKYEDPVMFVYHPHGIFTISLLLSRFSPYMRYICGGVSDIFQGTMMLKLIDLLFGKGCVISSVAKGSMVSIMESGRNMSLCPGGFEEACLHSHKANVLYLNKKMGFIKLCLVHGYNPVIWFAFGENNTYYNVQGLFRIRLWIAKHGIPSVVFAGLLWIFPKSLRLRCVVSEPIAIPHIPNPTMEDVVKYHRLYVSTLKVFYEKHRGPNDVELVIR